MELSLDELTVKGLTEGEKQALARRLRELRSPSARAWNRTRRALVALSALISVYSCSVAFRTYRFATSDEVELAAQAWRSGVRVYRMLREDKAFCSAVTLYVRLKSRCNPEFERELRHFKHYYNSTKENEGWLREEARSLYDPREIVR
jgi:hypothetical protein